MDNSPVVSQLSLPPLFVPISVSASGDTTIVAASAGRRIRVVRWGVVCAGAVVITWKSSVAGAVTGPRSFSANGGIEAPFCPAGIFQTAIGEGLVINLSGNISVGGELTYVKFADIG